MRLFLMPTRRERLFLSMLRAVRRITLKFNAPALTDSLAALFAMFDAGDLQPHVSHKVPLDRAQEALDLLAQRKSTGKVVVTI